MRPLDFALFTLAGTLLLAAGPSAGKPPVGNPYAGTSGTCYRQLKSEDVVIKCKEKADKAHPFTVKPVDGLTEKPIGEHRGNAEACAAFIQMTECINEKACKLCQYEDAQTLGHNWYDAQEVILKADGCKGTLKSKCQANMASPSTEFNGNDDDGTSTTKKSSATLVVIIVVVLGLLIVGGVVVYCLFFSGAKDEKKGAAGGVAASKGAPKTTKEVSGKSAKSKSASKSTKGAESSAKGKSASGAKSTAKSAVKSSISAGGKSAAKSSMADGKTASKASSMV